MDYFSQVIGLAEHKKLVEFFKRHGKGAVRPKYMEYVEEYPSDRRNIIAFLQQAIETCREEYALGMKDPNARIYNRFRFTYRGRSLQFNPLATDAIEDLLEKIQETRSKEIMSPTAQVAYHEIIEELKSHHIPITISLELRLKRNPNLWNRQSMRMGLISELKAEAKASDTARQLERLWFGIAHHA